MGAMKELSLVPAGLPRERAAFIIAMEREGMPERISRLIMRHATTVQRLAVAECNGDDTGFTMCPNWGLPMSHQGDFCPLCEGRNLAHGRVRKSLAGMVRAERRIALLCAQAGERRIGKPLAFVPVFSGDPRGACVKIRVPSGRSDSWDGDGMCVPTRRF